MKRVAVGLSGGVDSSVAALLLKEKGYQVVGVHLVCWPPKSLVEKDGLTRAGWIKKNGCRADEDRQAALKTALELDIPFQVLDFSEEYNRRVVDYFYAEYEAGRTPNPDVLCNSEIKFGLFLDWALEKGFDYVATGHYAQLEEMLFSSLPVTHTPLLSNEIILPAQNFSGSQGDESPLATPAHHTLRNLDPKGVGFGKAGNRAQYTCADFSKQNLTDCSETDICQSIGDQLLLSKGQAQRTLRNLDPKGMSYGKDSYVISMNIPKDRHKDQTYFLWKLGQKQLQHVLFPLGDYLKSEVREMAEKAGLSVAKRPDSQGICFIGEVDIQEFLKRRLTEKPGKVLTTEGEVIGEHKGIWFYTIGQRGGWQLTAKAQREYMKDGITPVFYVVSKDAVKNELVVGFGAETFRESFQVSDLNWIKDEKEGEMLVRIRHGGKLIKSKVKIQMSKLMVELMEPQRGIASGQSAVFYIEDPECDSVERCSRFTLFSGLSSAELRCLGGGVIV